MNRPVKLKNQKGKPIADCLLKTAVEYQRIAWTEQVASALHEDT